MNKKNQKKFVVGFIIGIIIGVAAASVIISVFLNRDKNSGTLDYASETSVTEEAKTDEESTLSEEAYSYTLEHVTLSTYGTCTYDKLTFTGPYNGIPKINDYLEEKYRAFADGIERDESVSAEDDESYEGYVYTMLKLGADVTNYCDICKVADIWKSEKYLCVTFKTEWYAGGAHGYNSTYGVTFDLETGDVIELSDIPLSDKQSDIKELLVRYFEIYFSDEDNYSDETAEVNAIQKVNDDVDGITFFIDDEGLEIYFNQYEIQCYAAGPTRITIPIDEFEIG